MRVALTLEQLLQPAPGGIGRYTAELARLLPALPARDGDETTLVPFVARHRREDVETRLCEFGLDGVDPVVLPLPRPLLYDAWHLLRRPRLGRSRRLRYADVVHAPSVAVPPKSDVPLVVTAHDAAPLIYPETYPRRGRRVPPPGLARPAEGGGHPVSGALTAGGGQGGRHAAWETVSGPSAASAILRWARCTAARTCSRSRAGTRGSGSRSSRRWRGRHRSSPPTFPHCGRSRRAPPCCDRPTIRMRGWPRSTTSCTTRPSSRGGAASVVRARRATRGRAAQRRRGLYISKRSGHNHSEWGPCS